MLRDLVEKFRDRVELPIEIDEVRDAIIGTGIQDKIVFSEEDMDTGKLKGVLYQWHEHQGVYSEPIFTSLIAYPKDVELEWQRAICAKELVHICDRQIVRTKTPEMVEELAEKLVGPFETNSEGLADLMASVDKLAQYQYLDLLFPKAARETARQKIATGTAIISDIADWAVLPEEHVAMALGENWEAVSEMLVTFGNGDHVT